MRDPLGGNKADRPEPRNINFFEAVREDKKQEMRVRKEIEKDAEDLQAALGTGLIVEVLLDIRDCVKRMEARLADAQANRDPFHVDTGR